MGAKRMRCATPRMSPQRKGLINVAPSVKVFKKIKVQYISLSFPPLLFSLSASFHFEASAAVQEGGCFSGGAS